ncbi:MAG TPA: TlpA disulfide reductase family protein [Kofleriaceae bacterium]|nr:TlpA disulfide reductase family protein [Kofleriaceae bacterium]
MRSLLVVCALAALGGRALADDELKVGDRLTELDTAVDASGKAFHLKAYKGHWVMLTFGASWCGPCAKELPAWDKLAPDWKGKVTFIAVDLDSKVEDGKRFHDKARLKNLLRVYLSPESAVAAKYGSDHMPTTVLADPSGVIRYVRGGFEKGDVDGEVKQMQAQLQKLVR